MAEKTSYQLMLEMAANLDPSYYRALEKARSGMKGLTEEEENSLSASQKLRREIRRQGDQLKIVEDAYTDVVLEQGKNSDEAKRLKQEYDRLNSELQQNKAKLDDVGESLGKTKKGAVEAKSGFTVLKGAVAGFLANAGTKLVEWGMQAARSIYGLADSTREYRKIMGSLYTSSVQQGYSLKQTRESYETLYGVLGDQQQAVTTTANLQALQLEQSKLQTLIDSVIGAWATYGDSIPIDGLAEAINETVKTGKVTGTFADVLNWGAKEGERYGVKLKANTKANKEYNNTVNKAASAEDFFNIALENCSSEAERANLIMKTLADQGLDKAGDSWQSYNDSLVAANKAQAEYDRQLSRLGYIMEPITTGVKKGLANMLTGVADVLMTIDSDKVGEGITTFFGQLSATALPVLQSLGSLMQPIGNLVISVMPMLTTTMGAIAPILQQITPLVSQIVDFVAVLLPVAFQMLTPTLQPISSFLQQIMPYITNMTGSLLPTLSTLLTSCAPLLMTFGNILGGTVSVALRAVTLLIDGLMMAIQGLLNFINDIFLSGWQTAWNNMTSFFSNAWGKLKNIAKNALNSVIDDLNKMTGRLVSMGIWIPAIPRLATGGIVSSPTLAMIGEGSEPEIVSPLSDFERMISEQSYSNSNSITFAPQITISGSADKEAVGAALDEAYERFKAFMTQYEREKRRTTIVGAY